MKRKTDSYTQFVLFSIAAHIVIFLLFTVKVLFFPAKNLQFDKVVRIDMVALPDKTPPAKPKPTKKEEPPAFKPKPPKEVKVEPKPIAKPKKAAPPKAKAPKLKPKKPVPKPQTDIQDSAIARLKAMKNLRDQNKAEEKEMQFKGNEISKGTGLVGIQKLHHNSYLNDLNDHIQQHWSLPQWMETDQYKAVVILLIDRNGGILNMSFLTTSGNDLFDQHVTSTLKKAEPLPRPPEDLVGFFENKGVEVRFPE